MLLKELFRWIDGRQDTGYQRMLFLRSRRFKFDVYLLRFPKGSVIASHVDTVSEGRHFRVNIILKKAIEGGHFRCGHCIINRPRLKVFRPDLYYHSVTRVRKGTRYVLSIGWVRNETVRPPTNATNNDEARSVKTSKGSAQAHR